MRNSKKIALRTLGNLRFGTPKNNGLTALLGAALLALGATGCTQDAKSTGTDFETRKTGLVAFDTCEDLLSYFQGEAKADLTLGYGYGYGGGVPRGIATPMASEDASGAPTGANAGGELGGDPPQGVSFSGTNTQEKDVDEGDLVKTDGTHIYVVRGGHLLIYAAGSLTLESDTTLDGGISQILLSGNQLVLIGSAYGAKTVNGTLVGDADAATSYTSIRVLDVADRGAPQVLRTMLVDGDLVASRLTGRIARLVVHHEPNVALGVNIYPGGGTTEPGMPVEVTPDAPPREAPDARTAGGGQDDPAQPADGGAVEPAPVETDAGGGEVPPPADADGGGAMPIEQDAGVVMPVEGDGGVDPETAWRTAAEAAIDATKLEDWVPQIVEVDAAGGVQSRAAAGCAQYFRPGERSGLGTTVVLSVDLDQPTAVLPDPAVVTATSIVYASSENLYLSTVNWRDFIGMAEAGSGSVGTTVGVGEGSSGSSGGGTATAGSNTTGEATPPAMDSAQSPLAADDASQPDDREATQIHRLSLPVGGGAAQYVASGRVHGQPLNQFSFSEFDGHLRVATTEHNWASGGVDFAGDPGTTTTTVAPNPVEAPRTGAAQQAQAAADVARSVTRVTVFDGDLAAVGQTPALAPNEEIYAVRFIDDRGFVVTYQQTDPLFTLDLADPTAPAVIGQLDLLGYSAYLHPVDDDHLLGIGYSGTEGGATNDLQLSLFDVADLSAPAVVDTETLGNGYSDALYDHHALTLFQGMLLLPITAYTNDAALDGLEVFSVDVNTGLAQTGTINHAALAGDGYTPHVDRSFVIGDTIYSVSNLGLMATQKGDLSEIGHAVFPAAVVEGGGGATRGGVPMPVDDKGV